MKVSSMFLLFLVFLVLKLCGLISWSWLWVTAPLWVPIGGFVLVGVFFLFAITIAGIFKH